ncbi:helix-turn-helix domain-containing protein [Gordonia lacunae]|uniref:Uncharacterized protein n=1 Tax=Gordonia lacunae TaxID=417102 RepID=A0A243QFJ0_9ACTN|nr:helix-turn-helix transcriptional regulator [Gordonia lacunae]OUC79564.1 hypothetical protein CA982_06585 [Gordonia lacunae]
MQSPEPRRYLSQRQVAERIGVVPSALGRYKLPTADVTIGPVDEDGTIPRGTVRGWLPTTIDEWHSKRPGRGARTDLHKAESEDRTPG